MNEHYKEIDVIKGLSLISVICAHCNSVPKGSSTFATVCSVEMSNIGTLGVICFFVISGFLFHYNSGEFVQFVKKKMIRLIIPWIIGATLVYLYVYLRKPPLSFYSWINFFIGNGSYFYYISVLLFFYILFSLIPIMRNDVLLLVCVISTMIFVSCNLNDLISPYLNPLNWIGYFAFGILLKNHSDKIKKFQMKTKLLRWIPITLYILVLIIQMMSMNYGNYWGLPDSIFCWIGSLALAIIGIKMSTGRQSVITNLLVYSGKQSFFIYIWHMPIAGIVTYLTSKGFLYYFVAVRPLLIMSFTLFLSMILCKLFKKMNIENYSYIIGLRR